MKKTLTVFLMTALVLSCVNNTTSESPVFKKGNLMTDVSVDPFGTPLVYPDQALSLHGIITHILVRQL